MLSHKSFSVFLVFFSQEEKALAKEKKNLKCGRRNFPHEIGGKKPSRSLSYQLCSVQIVSMKCWELRLTTDQKALRSDRQRLHTLHCAEWTV
jgi:hypothetical protein